MFSINYSLIVLITLTLSISMFYFYLFAKSKEKYISFWSFSWIMYSISLILSIFLFNNPNYKTIIGLKQICDLLSILFLLFGTYVFMGKAIPSLWIQYSFFNLIWILTAVYYNVSFITITLLPSIFLSAIAIMTGITIIKYWEISGVQRYITGIMFLIWGVHKAYYPYLNPDYWNSPIGYLGEIILANILNFCILLIYLQKIRNELLESENRFRLLAENAKDLIYQYRLIPNPLFVYVSPSSEAITGYSPEDFYKNPMFFINLVHPEDRPLLNEFLLFKTSPSESMILRWLHKDGHYVWIEQSSTLTYNSEGQLCGIEGILRDITDRKNAEENMLQSKKARQLLLTYISHELRTPITSILGYVTAMLDGTISQEVSKKDCLELIHSKSLMLQRLIQDLFQLTQLESKQFNFNFTQIAVGELIQNILKKHEWDIRKAGLILETFFDDLSLNDKEVIVDIERIHQVFSNLIFNAIKNTSAGGEIHISCILIPLENSEVRISIQDTGSGILPEDLSFIFERFYQGKNTSQLNTTGSGLGLTISKEIIEAHGGQIWVESKPLQGSTFYFTLPIYTE